MRCLPRIRRSGPGSTNTSTQCLTGRRLEPNYRLRGHPFFPPDEELAQIPGIAAARRTRPARRAFLVHYFTVYCDWYLCGFDPSTGEAFGYVTEPKADIQVWSYFDLPTMCLVVYPADPLLVVRRDLHWRPALAGQVIGMPASARPSSA